MDVKAQVSENKIKIIVMFGNSITYQGNWKEVIGRNDILNWGIPGHTTGQLIWTIKNVLHDYPGTKIWFLEGGINDITLGVPVNRIFNNYKIIVDSLRKNHIIPVVQSTLLKVAAKGDNHQVTKLNNLVKKYCTNNQIEYIDLNAFLSKNGELIKEFSTDGCHLKPDTYKLWGEAVKKILTKYNL
jgi:lysophospholipase L1-like esterase